MGNYQQYCGNKTGQNLSVTGDKVEIIFHSDEEIEGRGYLLNFTLVSSGKWEHREADKTSFSHIWNHRLRFCGNMLLGQRSLVSRKFNF